MKDTKFKNVKFNNRKRQIEVTYTSGKKYTIHYSSLGIKKNILEALIDDETKGHSIIFKFNDGKHDYMPYDQPLAIMKDPEYLLSTHIEYITAMIKKTLKDKKISKKYLAEQLNTSENQIHRLLNPTILNKNLEQLYKIISLLGYEFKISIDQAA